MGNTNTVKASPLQKTFDSQGPDAFIKAVWDGIVKEEDYSQLRGKTFDFDSLALEGGGVKGVAYAGAIKVLEDLGMLKNIKRFAGTSAGAYMAMQLAIGMSVDEIFKTNGIPDLQEAYYDSGTWSLPANITKYYGWQSGYKLLKRIEDDLERKLGDRNATFDDLYKKTGVELCIVVTNLNGRTTEHVHPKTFPTTKIALAVVTSMSLPLLFAPTKITEDNGFIRYLVDGGLLENYPIRVFDGWYLSMKPEDDFISRIQDDPATKFDGYNKKTLGMVVFSHGENQSHANEFLARYGNSILEGRPETKLSKKRAYTKEWASLKRKQDTEKAVRELVQYVAKEYKDLADEHGRFSYDDYKVIMTKLEEDRDLKQKLEQIIPEGQKPLEECFRDMDLNKDQHVSLVELLSHLTKKGIYLRYDLHSRHPRSIDDIMAYMSSILEVMQCYISELQEKPDDHKRTIGIYTDYVTTTDFDLTLDDKAYMCKLGYSACVNYLKEFDNSS